MTDISLGCEVPTYISRADLKLKILGHALQERDVNVSGSDMIHIGEEDTPYPAMAAFPRLVLSRRFAPSRRPRGKIRRKSTLRMIFSCSLREYFLSSQGSEFGCCGPILSLLAYSICCSNTPSLRLLPSRSLECCMVAARPFAEGGAM